METRITRTTQGYKVLGFVVETMKEAVLLKGGIYPSGEYI